MNSRISLTCFFLLTGLGGGSLTLASGCSPAAEPLPRGTTHYAIAFPTRSDLVGEGRCTTGYGGIGSGDYRELGTVPEIPRSGTEQLPTELGTPVIHTKEAPNSGGRFEVDCSVSSSGGSFDINARLEGPNSSPNRPVEGGLARIIVNGSIDAATGRGSGSVIVTATQNVTPNEPCELRALTRQDDASQFLLSEGEAAFIFLCPNAEGSLDSPGSVCETRGTVVVERCSN